MPRPRSLSDDQIAAAALALLDREGAAGLTMRALATELNIGTMSLYRYVADRSELEALVADAVLRGIDLALPPALPWDERAVELLSRARAALRAHPAALPLTVATRHDTEGARRLADVLLGLLAEGGFDGARRTIAHRALMGHVLGAVVYERFGPPGAHAPVDVAAAARRVAPDAAFHTGVAALLRGLRSA